MIKFTIYQIADGVIILWGMSNTDQDIPDGCAVLNDIFNGKYFHVEVIDGIPTAVEN